MNKNLIFGILFASSFLFVSCNSTQSNGGTGVAAGAAIGALAGSNDQRKYYGPQGEFDGGSIGYSAHGESSFQRESRNFQARYQ